MPDTATSQNKLSAKERLEQFEKKSEELKSNPQILTPDANWWWSNTNPMTVGTTVLVFGLLVLVLAAYLLKSGKEALSVLRLCGTIAIIVLAIYLVIVGYSDKQITLVMGLLGTALGYLLGKETGSAEQPAERKALADKGP